MNYVTPFVIAASALVLSACSDSSNFDFDASLATAQADAVANASPTAVFDPANGELPFPNSLLFGGTEDGTLNIPLSPEVAEDDFGDPTVALNTLDGFSLTQPITTGFSGPIDPESVVLGETVRAFEVTTDANGFVTGVVSELTAANAVTSVVGDTTLAFVPIRPLNESTDYMFIATSGVAGVNGVPSSPTPSFRLASGTIALTGELAALEPVRLAINSMLEVAAGQGVERASVVQAWVAKTQSVTPVLTQAMNAASGGGAIAVAPSGLNTSNISEALPGIADIFIGTLDIPYYQTAPENVNDPAAIAGFWRGQGGSLLSRLNPVPVANSVQTIPVLLTVPNANSGQTAPDAGWPIAIFVHGITRNRGDMLAIADSMAQAGYAVIAIDQPTHGIIDPNSPLNAANTPFPNDVERTFNLDLVDNATGAPGPDGMTDTSGTHFFSPAQLLNTRDNLRQSAADLRLLSASVAGIVGAPIDETRKALIGYSLGGTAATTYAAFDNTLTSVSLMSPAAVLVPMVIASPAFSDPILAGLEAAGLVPGTPEFNQFIVAAQTVIDGGDPINFGAQTAALHNVHFVEVVGDEAAGVLPDQVVLNTVPGAPLSGSSPLAGVMGLGDPLSSDTGGAGEGVSGLVRFIRGDHGSFIDPTTSQAATVEMQTQVATYAVSGGTFITIADPSVILVP